ncbi:restriction endonuclease subunit S [Morganella morganii]|uniref:restriction endonuclease subunit S n=1 Tax=Morganella morganii TaxID=582 RepID=UPI000538ADC9|nr:restriction endonuclease subunit S [Morganella morganii]AUT99559.1 restriction endonuclease subunit S [Morganella morganii]AVD58248.1 restriction endonuclease subunit S [Morganella morganii]EHZ6678754.1 restriction endonuclease subunit S [Morganella morganii]EKU8061817.1 restriction endonuclease subunit S [Morganella morganii]EKW8501072.1 restriction endonuclease subunit S [Morganella morganii]
MTVEKLITDHIDIWSSALQTRSAAGRGSNGKIDLYGIKKLRELILELAVRGKLVPQDPNDEPASELLKQIAKERNDLVKNKVIRKPKALEQIALANTPFDLPDGWEWCYLNDIGNWGAGATPSRSNSKYYNGEIPWFKSGELSSDFISDSEEKITELALQECSLRDNKAGDVLIAMYGATIGKTSILNVRGTTNQAVCACTPYSGISNIYLLTVLKAYKRIFIGMGAGGAQPNISREKLIATVFALPPKAEQNRIICKVDELMSLCDQLEQQSLSSLDAHQQLVETLLATLTDSQDTKELSDNWARISQYFGTLFTTEASIDALKQTILQLAVMGKLVPQDPNDEPAFELLKRIEQEKAELVKQGKIKKQKPLPPVSDEEKPFELPQGWEWCRIIEIAQVGTGATPSRDNPDYWETPEFNWVTSGETSLPFIFNTAEKISGKAVKETNVSIYSPGTLIIAMYGQGKTRGQITELCISAGTNQACAAIQLFNTNEYHRCYIKLFFEKSYKDLRELAAGGAQPNLNLAKVSNTLVPIPPLSEQIKITCKVEELIKVCDTLKSRLQSAQQTQLHLADALTDAALN